MKALGASVAGLALTPFSCALQSSPGTARRPVRFGIVADCHYADAEPRGSRFYRHSADKLAECVALMNERRPDFLIELGDFKDQGSPPVEERTLDYLQTIEGVFSRFDGPRYHVLGNHDMDSISKTQFLNNVENTGIRPDRSYYSFDCAGLHFVVLDANYRADGADYDHGNFNWTDANIRPAELDWLKRDLERAPGPAIVFIHQLLDGAGPVYVKNAESVRRILEQCGKVPAVFQGHHHEGSYRLINGIHYYTLRAMVEGPGPENNSYAIVEVLPDGGITITGYQRATGMDLAPVTAAVAG